MSKIDPSTLGPSGRRLYDSTIERFDLAPHELELLAKAAQCLDTIDELSEIVDREGYVIQGAQGPKTHPAQTERRAVLAMFERIIRTLAIPELDDQ